MDAMEFIRERNRMCKCKAVHLNEKMVPVVEEWACEHPIRKTRQSVFLEQYPDAAISDDGLPDIAPCQLCVGLIHGESTEDCENRGLCVECRKEYWLQEVE